MNESDWTKVAIEISGMGAVAIAAFYAVKAQVQVLSVRFDYQEAIINGQANLIKDIQVEIKKITAIAADLSIINRRLTDQDGRIARSEQDIRDLQRGEGMIIPLKSPFEHG